ncbi:MAG: glycine/sarcosine/betaine reductase component B subunit [Syntrophaceae bacterium]
MRLELRKFTVKSAKFGKATKIEQGALTINKQEMVDFLNRGQPFASVDVKIAMPGEKVRIVHIMDAVQPRIKLSGGTTPYPGAVGPMEIAGNGQTNVLNGVAVLQTGKRLAIEDGIVDMSGPGARYTIFSNTINIVLLCSPHPDTSDVDFEGITRKAALDAAVYLAEPTRNMTPDKTEIYDLSISGDLSKDLTRVVYIYLLDSHGVLRDTFVYGERVREQWTSPTLLHPNEVLDGAIVSNQYTLACQKNPTYVHVQNPVVLELMKHHGEELNFVGVVIATEPNNLRAKQRSAKFSAKLAKQLGAQGAIITHEGGSHADVDLMATCRECEKLGIKTVIIARELAGEDADLQSLVDTAPEANAAISTGNNDMMVDLPAMEQAIGGTEISGIDGPPEGEFAIAMGRFYSAVNQLGAGYLTIATDN